MGQVDLPQVEPKGQKSTDEWLFQVANVLAQLQQELQNILEGRISAENIKADSITANKINVSELSAISANLGTITAGLLNAVTIIGSLIQTSVSSYPRVELSPTDALITAASTATKHIGVYALNTTHGSPSLEFFDGIYQSGIRQNGDTLVIGTPTGPMSLSATGLMSLIANQMSLNSSTGPMPATSSGGSVSDIPSAINSKQNAFIGLSGTVNLATTTTMTFSNGVLLGYA